MSAVIDLIMLVFASMVSLFVFCVCRCVYVCLPNCNCLCEYYESELS